MQCSEANVKEPCFATYACQCNNGYSRVSSLMPDLTTEEATDLGVEEIAETTESVEEDDEIFLGLVLWQVIVYGVGALILLVLITWIIVLLCKKCKARRAKIEQGKFGGTGVKSATVEMKKKKKNKPKNGADLERRISIGEDMRINLENRIENPDATNDEKEAMEIANPDSFLNNDNSSVLNIQTKSQLGHDQSGNA